MENFKTSRHADGLYRPTQAPSGSANRLRNRAEWAESGSKGPSSIQTPHCNPAHLEKNIMGSCNGIDRNHWKTLVRRLPVPAPANSIIGHFKLTVNREIPGAELAHRISVGTPCSPPNPPRASKIRCGTREHARGRGNRQRSSDHDGRSAPKARLCVI